MIEYSNNIDDKISLLWWRLFLFFVGGEEGGLQDERSFIDFEGTDGGNILIKNLWSGSIVDVGD